MSNILIIKHGSLGDIAQASGAIQDISENHKNDQVYILTTKPYFELFKKNPFIQDVILDKRLPKYNLIYLYFLMREIKKYKFSKVFDLQNSSRTNFYKNILFPKAGKDIWSSSLTTMPINENKEMFDKNLISQRDLDNAQSAFKLTKIALENAKQDLSYCTIKAPFDGVVGARHIENNSYVRAGDTIATLQDRSQLYFSFQVPERIMTANAGNQNIKATAFIIDQEDKVFDIHYVEHETTPDPISQTYNVTFAIDGEVTNLFFPGSRATVKIELLDQDEQVLIIPLNALVGDKAEGFFVWRFNPEKSVVEKVKVEVAKLLNNKVVIAKGIKAGDKIVSAAVVQMRENLKVKEYKAEF